MRVNSRSTLLLLLLFACVATSGPAPCPAADPVETERFFEQLVRPLLLDRCIGCHGPDKQQGDVRLDSSAGLKGNMGAGPLVVAGSPDKSRIIQVTRYSEDDVQMPPAGRLPDDELAILTRWVQLGGDWPAGPAESASTTDPVPRTPDGAVDIVAAAQSHWAYQPIRRPALPQLRGDEVLSSTVDRFVRDRLRSRDLTPAEPADRRTLMRRAYFDLIGLPPTYEEVQKFSQDTSPDAWERLIDQLLASPLYGQRWGRHWLDVARYADTKGYVFTENPKYPFAYTYRDYVVDSLNADKPFDRFVLEQLAADQLGLSADDPALAAMGFLTVGRRFLNSEPDIIDDRIDVVTRGLMGMTVGCARCHDHKYDPIPTADYYGLYGVFASSVEPGELPVIGGISESAEYRAYVTERDERQRAVDEYVAEQRAELLDQARSARAIVCWGWCNWRARFPQAKNSLSKKASLARSWWSCGADSF